MALHCGHPSFRKGTTVRPNSGLVDDGGLLIKKEWITAAQALSSDPRMPDTVAAKTTRLTQFQYAHDAGYTFLLLPAHVL